MDKKQRLAVLGVLLIASLGIRDLRANALSYDNFDATARDVLTWGSSSSDFIIGSGPSMVQENGHVYLQSASAVGTNGSAWNYQTTRPLSAGPMAIQLDVNVPSVALGNNQALSFGLAISATKQMATSYPSLMGDTVTMSLRTSNISGSFHHGFYSALWANNVMSQPLNASTGYIDSASTSAAVRIYWDGTSLIHLQYDIDGATNGYTWLEGASFNPITTLGMSLNDTLTAGLISNATNFQITDMGSMVWGDNFYAVPEPSAWMLLILSAVLFSNKLINLVKRIA